MRRTHKHWLIHYLALPILLVGSDIFIGIFGHYSGSTDSLEKIFSWEHIVEYFTGSWQEILMVVVVAFLILILVEYLIRDIVSHNKRR